MGIKSRLKRILTIFSKAIRIFILVWFFFTFLLLVLSFTTIPFWWTYNLAREGADFVFEPNYVVLMGGSGMPGRSALIRAYYTAKMAGVYPNAKVIIAMPDDTTRQDNQLMRMKKELMLREVVEHRIVFEPVGTNSRSQALNVREMLKTDSSATLLLVSDPEHIYRSVKSFRKVGFRNVASQACFEDDIKVSLSFDAEKLGGKKYVVDIGNSQQLRYQFWNHLKYEINLLREYMAILYYRIQGWL